MIGFNQPIALILLILIVVPVYRAFKNRERYSKIVNISRALLIVLISVAAASPFTTVQEPLSDQPRVTILKDKSASMNFIGDPRIETDKINMRQRTIATGNSSNLKQGLYRNLEENTHYLVLSDFQSSTSLEGVEEKFKASNSTLNLLKANIRDEASVYMEGPESTVPGVKNSYQVTVKSTGSVPKPEVLVDGEKVILSKKDENTWTFNKRFQEEGSHTIKASIGYTDQNDRNDRFYHVTNVRKKPKILVIGEDSGMNSDLEKFYRVETRDSVPEDLSPYYSIVLKKHVDESLASYISEGNGLVYTGSYEENKEVLPVKKTDSNVDADATETMIVLDNSKDLGGEEGRSRSLKVGAAVIESLSPDNRIGLAYYNSTNSPVGGNAGIMSTPKPLSRNREDLLNRIAGLKPGGIGFHNHGLKAAENTLNGGGNIILITDGALPTGGELDPFKETFGYTIQQESFDTAAKTGSNLIIVGVGAENVDSPGGDEFLEELRRRAGGQYYEAERVLDQEGNAIDLVGGEGSSETKPIAVVNSRHFITEGLSLESYVKGFEAVKPKKGSRELVKVSNGNPFLTTWRYGLGRVAAFSGDTRNLDKIRTVDPQLFTRTMSWSIGDPQRKQDRWLEVESTRAPGKVEVTASYKIKGLKRQGEERYSAELQPNSLGIHQVGDRKYAYNYNRELQNVGYSDKAEELIKSTGGKVYNISQREKMLNELSKESTEKVEKKKPLTTYLLAAALLLFLAEVGYRKREGKK